MRTADGSSPRVGAGDVLFTTLGFCGLYALLSVLFLFLVGREIAHGPAHEAEGGSTRISAEVAP